MPDPRIKSALLSPTELMEHIFPSFRDVTVSAILTGYHGTPSRVDTLEFHSCLAFQVLFRSLDIIPYPFTHSPLVPWAIGLTPSGWIQLPCKLRSSYPLPLKDVYRTFIPLAHIRRYGNDNKRSRA